MGTNMEVDENLPEVYKNPGDAKGNPSDAEKKPFDLIKSVKNIIGKIDGRFEFNFDDYKELPNEFTGIKERLPRAKEALDHAIENLDWDKRTNETILPLAVELEAKANTLQNIFAQVVAEAKKTNGRSILNCYITVLKASKDPEQHRVEVLMLGILTDLKTLFSKTKTTFDLTDDINILSNVKPSVQDKHLAASEGGITQNNYDHATGHQYNGDGNQIHAGTGNFTINNNNVLYIRDDETWGAKSPFRHTPRHMDGRNQTQERNPQISDQVVGHNQLQHWQSQAHSLNSQAVNEGIAIHGGRPRGREDFQIAIICALPLEYDVVSLLFDQFWDEDESYGRARGDTNTYTTGRIGQYNVVLVLLPNMGTVAAAGAAASFRSSYPSLQVAFLVGICGGVPWNGENEIHLGDVVISKSTVQYDLGNQYHKAFVITDTVDDILGRPNKNIRSLVKSFETERIRDQLQQKACLYLKDIRNAAAQKRRRFNYQYPGITNDKLFIATYRHKHRGTQPCNVCDKQTDGFCEKAAQASCAELGCDETQLVTRSDSETRGSPEGPEIFIGRIASGNMVMKSGEYRDKVADEQNVIAFEMEGAGVWDEIPCIIVKGVCDYADSHRNDLWQRYAAAAAASVMKAVLGRYIMTDR